VFAVLAPQTSFDSAEAIQQSTFGLRTGNLQS